MAEIKIAGYRCERCGHEWKPMKPGHTPEVCPRCKSAWWEKPRQQVRP